MILNFDNLVRKHNIQAKGVLHLGASEGQEAPTYRKYGYKMAFVEALPNVFRKLEASVSRYGADCYNACVSDVDGQEVDFNVANNEGQSSSFLEFGTHSTEHPTVKFVDKIRMKTCRVDTLIKNIEDYDLLVMDLQGAELHALRGMGDKLKGFNYVYTEVNAKELYKGCPLIGDIDNYLKRYGFVRVETNITKWSWGDCFYVKKQIPAQRSDNVMINTNFQPRQRWPYPDHNKNEFEWWFFQNYKPTGEEQYEYLPIMWTSFQLIYEKNRAKSNQLQQYLNGLYRSKKYFTIVQHDDGIKFDLPFECKVFGMGKESDYPLPLICEPHDVEVEEKERDILANFVGNLTHRIRRQIPNSKGFYVSSRHHNAKQYCDILSRSVFTLCPRGYGISSFRIMEALQFGSIPVYISDRFIIPHNVPFEDYGVTIHSSQVHDIKKILADISVDQIIEKQSKLKEAFEKYYTYEANLKLIHQNVM